MQIRSVLFSRAAYKPEDFPRDGRPQFAIVGRSNVGKSSLINTILNRKKVARVSQTPGKTQAIQFYLVNEKFYIVDLPGYGYAKVPKEIARSWGKLSRDYFGSAEDLERVYILIDIRREPGDEDRMMIDWLDELGIDWSIVLTKSDKVSNNEAVKRKQKIAAVLGMKKPVFILFSTIDRSGVRELWSEVDAMIATSAAERRTKTMQPDEGLA